MAQWQTEFVKEYGFSASQIDAFALLLDELSARADRGLTAVTGKKSLVNLHFRDSLVLLDFPEMIASNGVLDIGSGAGFPGLPLAIARPRKEFSLLEANRRKCEFIRQMVSRLALGNVNVINARAEDLARTEARESFDLALARAVASMPAVLEYSLPLVAVGGSAVLQRGRREEGDASLAASVAGSLGGQLDRIEPVRPYIEAENLNVWIFKKTDATPVKYPRRAGIPGKRPLGP